MFNKILILVTLCVYCSGNEPIFRNDYKYYNEANGWFKLHLGPMKWSDARFMCDYEGAVLASPLNNQVQSGIVRFLKDQRRNSDIWYTGISAPFTPGFYQSIEGIDSDEMPISWAEDEPAYADGCIVFYSNNGTMGSKSCTSDYPFICYKAKQNAEMVRNECGTVDHGYRRVKGSRKCYKYHSETVTNWHEAYRVCYAEGGQLAIDYNIDLNEFSKNPTSAVFIGYILMRGAWYDITGNLMKPYTTGDFRGSYGARTWDGQFIGEIYYSEHPFLCEKVADKIV